jgi:hypothetical protein
MQVQDLSMKSYVPEDLSVKRALKEYDKKVSNKPHKEKECISRPETNDQPIDLVKKKEQKRGLADIVHKLKDKPKKGLADIVSKLKEKPKEVKESVNKEKGSDNNSSEDFTKSESVTIGQEMEIEVKHTTESRTEIKSLSDLTPENMEDSSKSQDQKDQCDFAVTVQDSAKS